MKTEGYLVSNFDSFVTIHAPDFQGAGRKHLQFRKSDIVWNGNTPVTVRDGAKPTYTKIPCTCTKDGLVKISLPESATS